MNIFSKYHARAAKVMAMSHMKYVLIVKENLNNGLHEEGNLNNMASYVLIKGSGFQGKLEFEDAEKAFEFYFEQCKDDRYTLIIHDDKIYKEKLMASL